MLKLLGHNRSANVVRDGAAAVEMAVCLPILLLLLIATVDICGMFHVQQSLKVAAYEGTRVGIIPGSESENVTFQVQSILDAHGVNGYTIAMTPADPSTLEVGDYFTVSIAANFDDNAYGSGLYVGKVLNKSVTLKVE